MKIVEILISTHACGLRYDVAYEENPVLALIPETLIWLGTKKTLIWR